MKKIILFFILNFMLVQNLAFSQDFDIYKVAYIQRIQNKVKSNWVLPHGQVDEKTVVILKINKDGKIINANITDKSGDEEFDQNALTAIYKSAPFESIPKGINNDNITISIIFNQNLLEATMTPEIINANFSKSKNIENMSSPLQSANFINSVTNIKIENDDINEKNITDGTNFNPYMKSLQNQIKSNWHPVQCSESRKIVTLFKIEKDGALKNLMILKSSGNDKADEAALKAIYVSAPFSSLPQEFKGKSINIEFTFDYNVFMAKNYKYYSNVYDAYEKQVKMIIFQSLAQQRFYFHRDLLLNVVIDKLGRPISIKVAKTSGNKSFDNKIISNIKGCSFPPIPDSIDLERFYLSYRVKTERNKERNTALITNNYYAMPTDFSSPVAKVWALDRALWWSFLITLLCHVH